MIDAEMQAITAALSAVRVPAQPEEYDIHAAVARALEGAGLDYEHEYRLGPRRRIDFLLPKGDNYRFTGPTTVTVTKAAGAP